MQELKPSGKYIKLDDVSVEIPIGYIALGVMVPGVDPPEDRPSGLWTLDELTEFRQHISRTYIRTDNPFFHPSGNVRMAEYLQDIQNFEHMPSLYLVAALLSYDKWYVWLLFRPLTPTELLLGQDQSASNSSSQ